MLLAAAGLSPVVEEVQQSTPREHQQLKVGAAAAATVLALCNLCGATQPCMQACASSCAALRDAMSAVHRMRMSHAGGHCGTLLVWRLQAAVYCSTMQYTVVEHSTTQQAATQHSTARYIPASTVTPLAATALFAAGFPSFSWLAQPSETASLYSNSLCLRTAAGLTAGALAAAAVSWARCSLLW